VRTKKVSLKMMMTRKERKEEPLNIRTVKRAERNFSLSLLFKTGSLLK
jgi:hypothetical protein